MAPPFELDVYDSKEPLRYAPSTTSRSSNSNNLSPGWPQDASTIPSPSYSTGEHGQMSPLLRSSSTWTNLVDGFKRDPHAAVNPNVLSLSHGSRTSFGGKSHHHHSHSFDAEVAAQATASSPLARSLKGRHLQMIAIGGSIGEW